MKLTLIPVATSAAGVGVTACGLQRPLPLPAATHALCTRRRYSVAQCQHSPGYGCAYGHGSTATV